MKEAIEDFKWFVRDGINTFMEISDNQYEKTWGGKKGNVTLNSYDGKYRLRISIGDTIIFDDRIQITYRIIVECFDKWIVDAMPEIRIIVNNAFRIDKDGNISASSCIGIATT
jgi:hypothetical protein